MSPSASALLLLAGLWQAEPPPMSGRAGDEPPAAFAPMPAGHPDKEPISTFRQKRLEHFAAAQAPGLRGATVFVGDSITQGYDLRLYYGKRRVANRGIGGDTIGGVRHQGVLDRLAGTVYDLDPGRIVLMIGVNDLLFSNATPFETKVAQYEHLIRRIRRDRPETELFSVSVLPVRGRYAKKNEDIRRFNREAAKAAARHGAKWVDVHRSFADAEGSLDARMASDDVHLSRRGYRRLTVLYRRDVFRERKPARTRTR